MNEVFKCCEYEDDPEVWVTAVSCIVDVVSNFYPFIENFITQIKNTTLKLLGNDENENVWRQAIEVWNSIADEEYYRQTREGQVCFNII